MVEDRGATATVEQALSDLFDAHYRSLLGTARLLLDDPGSAEEVVQEAFAQLWVAWRRLRHQEAGAAYLRATVVNLSRGRVRRLQIVRRHPAPAPDDVGPAEDVVLAREERRLLAATVRLLPGRQRECVVLRYYLELSERETAEALSISRGSVKTHLHRALATLSDRLEALR